MTKPPETIWATIDSTGYHFTAKGNQPRFEGVEYIRADLAVTITSEDELAAAYLSGFESAKTKVKALVFR